jgi:hypothetical protein
MQITPKPHWARVAEKRMIFILHHFFTQPSETLICQRFQTASFKMLAGKGFQKNVNGFF